jgi:hypothetical protein
MTYWRHAMVLSALVISVSSCASSSGSGTSPTDKVAVRRNANVITAQELSQTGESNVYQAIEELRPQWVRGRSRASMREGGQSADVVVYIEGARIGNASALQQISINGVYDVQYLDASEATNRFGTGHTSGAIIVRTQKP